MLEVASRLAWAFTTWPRPHGWLLTLGVLLGFSLLALLTLRLAGALKPRPLHAPWPQAALLAVAAFFSPALLEESFFRVLLIPLRPGPARLFWAALSLGLYVLAHPLIAWRLRELRRTFRRPVYLAVVTLLGLACTFLYLRTGSVWPPVLVHGVTVALWKLRFGGPGRLPSVMRKWPMFRRRHDSAEW